MLALFTPAVLRRVFVTTSVVFALAQGARAADGYGGSATGGAGGTAVTVTTEAQFRQYATATAAYIITVSGSITLASPNDYVKVTSNKTIKGANTSATIIGSILINTGTTNVIVQNLNITAPNAGRDGIQIFGGKKVFITKCSIYNCTDGEIDMTGGADEITISWCKFYYTADLGHNYPNLIGNSDTDTGTYRITIHHNWYGAFCKQRMPSVRFGNCHVYNNYFSCSGNSHCTLSRNVGQVLAENNYYNGVANPCYKIENGKLRVNGNIYNNCTGSQFTTQDVVFTPSYSYTLDAAANVPSIVQAGAGNVSGGGGGGTVTTYQAENATIGGGTVTETKNAGYLGTGYLNFSVTGGFAEFASVNGGAGGASTLAIRYALGAAARTGVLKINGVAQSITFADTGAFTTWNTMNVPVTLNGGTTNTVRFESNGQDLGNIDQITLTAP